jgi:hypothetical protein
MLHVQQLEMVKDLAYRKIHRTCDLRKCKVYTAYIRVDKKLQKIGLYYSKCGKFIAYDKEARDLVLGLSLMSNQK